VLDLRGSNIFTEDLVAATRGDNESSQQFRFKVGAHDAMPQPLMGATLRSAEQVQKIDKSPVPILGLRSLPCMQS